MTTDNSRSKQLLEKVYDRLEGIDLDKLSLCDMKDFLEVVQKGQFLESYGSLPSSIFGGYGSNLCCAPYPPTEPASDTTTTTTND